MSTEQFPNTDTDNTPDVDPWGAAPATQEEIDASYVERTVTELAPTTDALGWTPTLITVTVNSHGLVTNVRGDHRAVDYLVPFINAERWGTRGVDYTAGVVYIDADGRPVHIVGTAQQTPDIIGSVLGRLLGGMVPATVLTDRHHMTTVSTPLGVTHYITASHVADAVNAAQEVVNR